MKLLKWFTRTEFYYLLKQEFTDIRDNLKDTFTWRK